MSASRFGNVGDVKSPWLVLAVWLAAPWVPAESPSAKRPNIVLILADDLGWTDSGFAGSRFYETPNLDALAAGGMRFMSFYASPVGLPTRAALLSGQYSPRTGVYAGDFGDEIDGAKAAEVGFSARTNLASVLKGAGYATGYLGSWGFSRGGDLHPVRLGFDEAVLTGARHVGFAVEPEADLPPGTHLVDFLTDQALDFLDRHRAGPFFLVLSHFSVHEPVEPKKEWVGRFEKKPPSGGHRDAAYAAMIAGLDAAIGRVIARIESLQLTDRTVVLFSSDNGGLGMQSDPESGGRRTGVTDNAPLRGGKGAIYEGGLRVPFLVRWPGVVTPGSRTSEPVSAVDLFPTLCEAAGVASPAGHPVDGLNLLPLWRDASAPLGRDALYWHFPVTIDAAAVPAIRTLPVGVVRAGNFKLIEWLGDGRLELYNVVEDLGEKNNLVRSLPEKTSELKAKLVVWRQAIGAPAPGSAGSAQPPTFPTSVPEAPSATPASDPKAAP
ncbi:MAG: sulfatase [Limisphaerales bacterium]